MERRAGVDEDGSMAAPVRDVTEVAPMAVDRSDDVLMIRIRSEYDEVPGLRLTVEQACRFWQIDPMTCGRLLHRLLLQNVLAQTKDGAFIAAPRA
jgi:hypothetical protein